MTSDARGSDAPFRVLVENESALGPVFRVDPERFAAALDRHPAWRGRLRVTFSEDGDRFESAIGTANLLIGWHFPREHLASRAPCLRWIHLTGAGVNHLLPLDWLPAGTVLTNNRGVHAPKCQEFVTMALLLLANRIPTIVRREALPRHGTRLIAGQRATVVGVGSMGGAAARAARQLGLHVTGVRRSGQPHPDVDVMYATDALHTAVTSADHVVICVEAKSRAGKFLLNFGGNLGLA